MRLVVVPSTPALLPQYAGLEDPVADLRRACLAAVSWLVEDRPATVALLTAAAAGPRVAAPLLAGTGWAGELRDGAEGGPDAVLVVANGTATRSVRAPGHLDPRAAGFDAAVGDALVKGDPAALRGIDVALGAALWCPDAPALRALGEIAGPVHEAVVDYDDDPYGVQYWVVRWTCGS